MNRELRVAVDLDGQTVPCGRLWCRATPRESASFEYDASWLARADAFSIDPELPLARGPSHTPRPLFRAFLDPAPDRWGQALLRRAERAAARREGRAPHTLTPVDFLIRVDDATRVGALRFQESPAGPFLATGGRPVPPVVDLPKLLAATQRLLTDDETEADLALLLAPGTSLGGARPKASVRATDGGLLVAKFPRKDDEWPTTRWEAITLELARLAGLEVARARLSMVARRPVLLLDRFDRTTRGRTAMMSAMTALAADDGESRSYLEVADVLRRDGSRPDRDLKELWRRMVFSVLVSNTDDHLRNHAFLRETTGWRLAPAYDLNPTPTDVRPRIHALALDESDATASFETLRAVAPRLGLSSADARSIGREVASAVATWRSVAAKHGLTRRDVDRMASAFEHRDLAAGLEA